MCIRDSLQVADTRIVLGEVARRSRTVLFDHVEEAGTVGVAFECELIIRILLLKTVLSLGDPLGGFGGARGYDQCAVSENKGCKNQQSQKNIRHVTAVFLEEKLSSVHCFAEGLLLGYMLLCHMKNILF